MPAPVTLAVGSYAPARDQGVHLVTLDPATGALSRVDGIGGVGNPSWVAAHPSGRFLYAVSEAGEGSVAAFALHADAPRLAPLGTRPSGAPGPCHLGLDAEGRALLVSCYNGGAVASFPLVDGAIGERASLIAHHGHGPDARRQEAPHAHQAVVDPSGCFALVCDLGTDRVVVYRLDAGAATLTAHCECAMPAGSGPRHLAFLHDGRAVAVVGELDSTVTVCGWDATGGELVPRGAVSTVPAGHQGVNHPAAIGVAEDGRFVYVSNRGRDDIAVLVCAEGALTLRANLSGGGRTPRGMTLAGGHLIVANQDSDALVSFALDLATGMPTRRATLALTKPTSVVAVP